MADGAEEGVFERRGVRDADELLGVVIDEADQFGTVVRTGMEGHEDEVVPEAVGSAAIPGIQFRLQAVLGRRT